MQFNEMKKIMLLVAEFFPKFNVSESRIKAFQIALSDIEYNDAVKAVILWSRAEKFEPTVADILATANEVRSGGKQTPEEVWEKCLKLFSSGDINRFFREADPLMLGVVRKLGGFSRLSKTDLDSLVFVRKEFIFLYKQDEELKKQSESRALLNKMIENKGLKDDGRKLLS